MLYTITNPHTSAKAINENEVINGINKGKHGGLAEWNTLHGQKVVDKTLYS